MRSDPRAKEPAHPVKSSRLLLSFLLCFPALMVLAANSPAKSSWQFEITVNKGLTTAAKDGRLFLILAQKSNPEPRLTLNRTGLDAPEALARDVTAFASGTVVVLDQSDFAFPIKHLSELPAGDYFAQALFDCNADLRSPQSPGNLYSKPQRIHFDPGQGGTVKLELTQQIPPSRCPRTPTRSSS